MRDYIQNPNEFCKQVEKKILALVQSDLENLRSDVINNSNLDFRNLTTFFLKDLRLMDYIRLGILSWFIPKEIGFILREDLCMKMKHLSLEDRIVVTRFLSTKGEMLIYLQETSLWHSRDFFGNLLGRKNKLDRFLRLSPIRKKLKKPERKRGYDDKGSRVPEDRWQPSRDFSLTELQNQIEQSRQSFDDTNLIIQGWLT